MSIESLLGIISAPAGIILGIIIKGVFDRRTSKDTAQVQEKSGRTQEMEVAFDGLTANMNSLQEQLKEIRGELRDAKADGRRTQDELNTTRSDLRRLETTVSDLRVERAGFILHIAALEKLIPIPPGPPPRPSWMTVEKDN